MKNFQIRCLAGLSFVLLFIFNISLVVIGVIKGDDLYVAYAILLSCAQFYLYEKLKISRMFFESHVSDLVNTERYSRVDERHMRQYDIHLN
jgi:hypothetical protein